MANIKSSKKSIRKIAKLTLKNKSEKSSLKTLSKKLEAVKSANDVVASKTLAIAYMSALDKAGKHGILHANKVNRLKSRLTAHIIAATPVAPVEAAASAE